MWTCGNKRCRLQKPVSAFEIVIAKHGKTVKGDSRQCDECVLRRQAAEMEQSRKNVKQVQRTTRMDAQEVMLCRTTAEQVAKKARTNKKSDDEVNKKPRKK
jgi:hypothetical protein